MTRTAERGAARAAYLLIGSTTSLVLALVVTLAHLVGPGHDGRTDSARDASARAAPPPIRHVFVVNLENTGFARTWGSSSAAPYLARTLRSHGLLLTRYYATAHHSLGNYLAQISGQGPDLATQHDCPVYSAFKQTRPVRAPGQVVGNGCVYPAKVGTLPGQLDAAGLSWRGYLEDLPAPCAHSRLGAKERWVTATPREQYASRHNPFVYFRSITSRPSYCRAHVTALPALTRDLQKVSTTRNLTYLTPDLCHDAHDARCATSTERGGLRGANDWLKTWVPRILASPAYRRNGLLVITADESEGPRADSRACCGEGPGPNAGQPGIDGPGGGRVGALVLSPYVAAGGTSSTPYNHYSLLASIEDMFGLRRLGYARTVSSAFGPDVYTAP